MVCCVELEAVFVPTEYYHVMIVESWGFLDHLRWMGSYVRTSVVSPFFPPLTQFVCVLCTPYVVATVRTPPHRTKERTVSNINNNNTTTTTKKRCNTEHINVVIHQRNKRENFAERVYIFIYIYEQQQQFTAINISYLRII